MGDKHFDSFACDTSFTCAATQTEIEVFDCDHNRSNLSIDTQTDIETYFNGDKVQNIDTVSCTATGTQTENSIISACFKTTETQTDWIDVPDEYNNNMKCHACEKAKVYASKLERDVVMSNHVVAEMQLELNKYENNLNVLEKFIEERQERNCFLQDIIKSLEAKIDILQNACIKQKERLDGLTQDGFAVKNKCGTLC